jgi:biotin transport system substrate-specific component
MNITAIPRPRTLADIIPQSSDRVRNQLRTATLVFGFAALTAVFAQIRFTLSFTPVPVTGQTFAVLLAGAALGWRRGIASQAVYWIVGIAMPIPWYADDQTGTSIREGWNVATGTTMGYFVGFIVAAGIVGYLAEIGQDRDIATSIPAMLAGTAAIYVCGVVWLAYDLNIPIATGDANAIAYGLTPFLIGDTIKLVAAGLLTPLAWRGVNRFMR